MPKAYSVDLRRKLVDAYDRGGVSQARLAKQFGVAQSFVEKLLKQRRESGSLLPKVRATQTPPKLNEEHRAILAELVEASNDATLAELRERLYERTGVKVGITTVHNTLKRMGLTVKKNVPSRRQGYR